jgi:hypothetical protein
MFVRLRMLRYAAVAALVVTGLVSIASAANGVVASAPDPCPPSYSASGIDLVAAPESVAAGQSEHFRIDNSKGPAVTYGTPYAIQECLSGVWVLAPFSPRGPWTKQLIRQRPSRGRWCGFLIPATAATGEYRVRKAVDVGSRGRWLYGDFGVVAAGSGSRPAERQLDRC